MQKGSRKTTKDSNKSLLPPSSSSTPSVSDLLDLVERSVHNGTSKRQSRSDENVKEYRKPYLLKPPFLFIYCLCALSLFTCAPDNSPSCALPYPSKPLSASLDLKTNSKRETYLSSSKPSKSHQCCNILFFYFCRFFDY